MNVTGNYRVNGNVVPAYNGYISSSFGDPNDMFPENTADTTSISGLGRG